LDHHRGNSPDENGRRNAFRTVASQISRHLATASRIPDVNGVVRVERFDERGEIVRVRIHFVSVPRLAGPAMFATVACDAAIAVAGQEQHLVFPGVRSKRPSVAEDHGLPELQFLKYSFVPAGVSMCIRLFLAMSAKTDYGEPARRAIICSFRPVSSAVARDVQLPRR
jgi:hypothetical protein